MAAQADALACRTTHGEMVSRMSALMDKKLQDLYAEIALLKVLVDARELFGLEG
jgi:hypothetical protein